jgi:hypothetical protein
VRLREVQTIGVNVFQGHRDSRRRLFIAADQAKCSSVNVQKRHTHERILGLTDKRDDLTRLLNSGKKRPCPHLKINPSIVDANEVVKRRLVNVLELAEYL